MWSDMLGLSRKQGNYLCPDTFSTCTTMGRIHHGWKKKKNIHNVTCFLSDFHDSIYIHVNNTRTSGLSDCPRKPDFLHFLGNRNLR